MPDDQRIVPFLEIDLWLRLRPRRRRNVCQSRFKARCELIGTLRRTDDGTERADHRQNAGDVALIEDVDRNAGAHQIGDDAGLQVGEGEHEVGLERKDLWNVRRDEGGDPRLLAPDLRRPHGIAGDADDAVLLTEQIQRLDGLFGQADDPAGRELAHDG